MGFLQGWDRRRKRELLPEFQHHLVETGDRHQLAMMTLNHLAYLSFWLASFALAPEHSALDWIEVLKKAHEAPIIAAIANHNGSKAFKNYSERGFPFRRKL